jgi:hypothetical protein
VTDDGAVYSWGGDPERTLLGSLHRRKDLVPRRIDGLVDVRIASVTTYTVTGTGELWAWGDRIARPRQDDDQDWTGLCLRLFLHSSAVLWSSS